MLQSHSFIQIIKKNSYVSILKELKNNSFFIISLKTNLLVENDSLMINAKLNKEYFSSQIPFNYFKLVIQFFTLNSLFNIFCTNNLYILASQKIINLSELIIFVNVLKKSKQHIFLNMFLCFNSIPLVSFNYITNLMIVKVTKTNHTKSTQFIFLYITNLYKLVYLKKFLMK